MPGTVVPYERFVEIRQRGKRMAGELAAQHEAMLNGDSRDGCEPPTIHCEALIDKHCGTRTQTAVALRRKNPLA
jgi:hypothetical protein